MVHVIETLKTQSSQDLQDMQKLNLIWSSPIKLKILNMVYVIWTDSGSIK